MFPAARSRNSSHTCPAAISRPLPLRSTTSEPEPAAKSPIVAAPPPSPTAISCLGAFRPPAIGARGKTFPPGGRKPAHKRSERIHYPPRLATIFNYRKMLQKQGHTSPHDIFLRGRGSEG